MDLSHLRPKEMVLYSNDVVINFDGGNSIPPLPGEKQPMTEFTKKSRAKLAFVASNTAVRFYSMMTLTYPDKWPNDGKEVKKNLRAMLSRLRRLDSDINYLWFLEFQKRGAPHIHLLLTTKSTKERKRWLSQAWHDIVNDEEHEKHLAAGTNWTQMRKVDGGRRYAVKYAGKMRQKEVPALYQNVGRFWGHSKAVKPEPMFKPIEIYSLEQMKHYLQRWSEAERLDKPLKTLYNAAVPLAEQLTLDGIDLNKVD